MTIANHLSEAVSEMVSCDAAAAAAAAAAVTSHPMNIQCGSSSESFGRCSLITHAISLSPFDCPEYWSVAFIFRCRFNDVLQL